MNKLIHALLLTLGCIASQGAAAQSATVPANPSQQVYAILSLVGDRLEIVVRGIQTGARIDQNRRDRVDINDPVFDNVAVSAAAAAIQKAEAGAAVSHLNTRSPVLFEKQRDLFEVSNQVMAMPDAIRNALREQGATRLVLIAKHRDEASFRFASGKFDGVGKIEGLGFYVDGTMETRQAVDDPSGSGAGRGFIAPYAYLTVSIVAFPSGQVLATKDVTDYINVGAGYAGRNVHQPWSALTSAEKVNFVNQIVNRSVAKTVTELLAAKPAS